MRCTYMIWHTKHQPAFSPMLITWFTFREDDEENRRKLIIRCVS